MDEIQIIDNATPWLRSMADAYPDWERKALKSVGWKMQQEIKKGIKSGAPGGQRYVSGMSNLRRRKLDKAAVTHGSWRVNGNNPFENTQRKPFRNYRPLGRLVNAVGYQYKSPSAGVAVGWLSRSAAKTGLWMEKGVTQFVTPKMRRLFYAAGVGVSGNTMHVPARPTMGPMFKILQPKVMSWIESKFLEYAANGAPARRRRSRYRVFE